MTHLRPRSRRRARARWLLGSVPAPEHPPPLGARGRSVRRAPIDSAPQLDEFLRRTPEVRCAWLLPRGADLELAFEGPPGTDLAAGARTARLLQSRLAKLWGGAAVHVVFLSGPSIVARRTGGATPVYVRGSTQAGARPPEAAASTAPGAGSTRIGSSGRAVPALPPMGVATRRLDR